MVNDSVTESYQVIRWTCLSFEKLLLSVRPCCCLIFALINSHICLTLQPWFSPTSICIVQLFQSEIGHLSTHYCPSLVVVTVIEMSFGFDLLGLNLASHAWSFLLLGIGAVVIDFLRLQQRQIAKIIIISKRISRMTPRVIAATSPALR